MNAWVKEIIIDQKLTRSLDVEITSSLYGYSILKKYKKLKISVNKERINYIFDSYTLNKHFFDNYTLSILIGISFLDDLREETKYDELINWLRDNLLKEQNVSDLKNFVFSYILFNRP
jgi:hypothetical protein